MQKWKYIDEQYLNYLRKYESRIPHSNYGDYKMKPFFGELFSINDLVYVTQVSSPKPRHKALKEQLDFRKMYDKHGRLISVINLNFMFPVPKNYLFDIEYKNIDNYRKFNNPIQKSKYIQLLKIQLKILNTSIDIESLAKQVYDLKINQPNSSIAIRSFDFKKLEEYAVHFNNNLVLV